MISPLKKNFTCGPTLREPFVRGYLHEGRKILEPERSEKGEQLYHLVNTCKVVVKLTVNSAFQQRLSLAKSGWVSFSHFTARLENVKPIFLQEAGTIVISVQD